MPCPTCRACVVAGICIRQQVPATAVSKPRRRPRRASVKATYPRDVQPGYVPLVCGHMTHKAEIEFYSVWAPKPPPVKYYCEKCGAWVAPIREPRPTPTESGQLW